MFEFRIDEVWILPVPCTRKKFSIPTNPGSSSRRSSWNRPPRWCTLETLVQELWRGVQVAVYPEDWRDLVLASDLVGWSPETKSNHINVNNASSHFRAIISLFNTSEFTLVRSLINAVTAIGGLNNSVMCSNIPDYIQVSLYHHFIHNFFQVTFFIHFFSRLCFYLFV